MNTEARFEFGKNWRRFLSVLSDERIAEAEKSLREMLACDDLRGKSFLDIGSGSGLFSLAARRLGARVHSFDFDPQSVACTKELRRRYFAEDPRWRVEQGSVLDRGYMESLPKADVVYAWGVLHHTGDMWRALEHAAIPVKEGGQFFVAIYNDQGEQSKRWLKIKKRYVSGWMGRWSVLAVYVPYFVLLCLKEDLLRRRNPLARYREYKKNRGMSILTDWIDWFGGYPFEVAKPQQIIDFYAGRGLTLVKLKTCGGDLANNEFVFRKGDGGAVTQPGGGG